MRHQSVCLTGLEEMICFWGRAPCVSIWDSRPVMKQITIHWNRNAHSLSGRFVDNCVFFSDIDSVSGVFGFPLAHRLRFSLFELRFSLFDSKRHNNMNWHRGDVSCAVEVFLSSSWSLHLWFALSWSASLGWRAIAKIGWPLRRLVAALRVPIGNVLAKLPGQPEAPTV